MSEFGKRIVGSRVSNGDGFYAVPAANVAAGAIFMPKYASSAQFGVAEIPVASGQLGFFATSGTFAFEKPEAHTSSAGQAIYYAPTDAKSGEISASSAEGSVLLGWEVVRPDIPAGLIYVDIARPTALEAGSGSGSGAA
ncbi:MAG: DUF2190 family protein [Thermoguttaceae bacterium]|nr:DUF2190 family protein [Thermoguttaceae bacterium]